MGVGGEELHDRIRLMEKPGDNAVRFMPRFSQLVHRDTPGIKHMGKINAGPKSGRDQAN